MSTKTNLEIVSRRENITARVVINGNTVTFMYDKVNDQVSAVAFSVAKGTQGSPEFTGQEMFRGTMYGRGLNVENSVYTPKTDSALQDEIFAIGQSIMNPEPQETEADDTSV
ncbi:hypothetical protein QIU18_00305 [Capnocytophaga canimorsus]|nr:hypothetical protein [Capnocytophaga canimorsus]WGU68262.1 hypothetical protein QIU19_13505 [Capnocytophaga canimorsus]WGU70635.1 hypothetical protein QIU18_00305 [Capnocytophaga canimorsus]